MKATHVGHCQGCGHHQKLPDGKLSLHGYTVAWGFFSGTCGGAKELPYELSCDYCKTRITQAEAQRDTQRAAAAHHRREIDAPIADQVTLEVGRDPRTYRSIKRLFINVVLSERTVSISPDHNYTEIMATVEHEGQELIVSLTGVNGALSYRGAKTALQAACMLNESAARSCDLQANQIQTYIDWQTHRVAEWKPQPLKTVEDEAKKITGGDDRLLKSLLDGPLKLFFYSSRVRFTRNGRYTQALKLENLGWVEVTERVDDRHPWIRVRLTEAGIEAARKAQA